MAKKNFGKIHVCDIAGNCGLTRQAFYYHFKDKYDLLNWIYDTETARFVFINSDMGYWMDGLKELYNYMRKNKMFYLKALNTAGQNSFQEYLHDYIRDISLRKIRNMEHMEQEEGSREVIAEAIAVIFVGLTVRWANSGMKEEPAEYIKNLRSLFDGSLLHEWERQSQGYSGWN